MGELAEIAFVLLFLPKIGYTLNYVPFIKWILFIALRHCCGLTVKTG